MIKLTGISLSLLFVLGFFGMAMIYVWFLTHPGCNMEIQPAASLPRPEELWLENSAGQKLRAWYYPPQNGSVVLAAGARTGSLGENMPPISFLVESGYAHAQYEAALPPKEFWLVPGGNHGINHLIAPEMYESKILDFFNRTLLY